MSKYRYEEVLYKGKRKGSFFRIYERGESVLIAALWDEDITKKFMSFLEDEESKKKDLYDKERSDSQT